VYPIEWNTIDDNDVVLLNNAAEVEACYISAVGTLRAYLDSGTSIKANVRAATTPAGVKAVADER
jgi:hypothetical protein